MDTSKPEETEKGPVARIRRYLGTLVIRFGAARGGAGAGTCGQCRHANHGTDDAEEGLWACPWIGPTSPQNACRIKFADTRIPVFEPYDGTNGTWRSDTGWRSIPQGYEGRKVRT